MKFTKMQGIGNDYVYVNCFKEESEQIRRQWPNLSVTGISASVPMV